MPQSVPLQAIPNQSFTVNLGGNVFDIELRAMKDIMTISMAINGAQKLRNARCVAGALVIPSRYLEAGNFLFLTLNGELPDYNKFTTTQQLVYFSEDDLAAYRVDPTFPVTEEFFNPVADVPLRFKPQGYISS